jgi:thioredoxin-like negative regulator of GroEL
MANAAYEVVCICAAWCDTCGQYRPGFDALAAQFPQAAFKWLDTEDDAEAVGDIEVENFPTILVKCAGQTLFLGPQPPSHDVLKRLLQALLK